MIQIIKKVNLTQKIKKSETNLTQILKNKKWNKSNVNTNNVGYNKY